jgi:hypothetical protein
MIRALLLFLALAQAAAAETARILSGEHASFTRLVIELPAAADWTVGRTPMGYAFAPALDPPPDYDLSRLWDRIPRTRLQALRVEPGSGTLLLTLACPCHVMPFDYRPGMVVLDIRDGPAPEGSPFELAFAAPLPPSPPTLPLASGPDGYSWIERATDTPGGEVGAPGGAMGGRGAALPLDTGHASLAPLRDELLLQISRGAAEGVVDMRLPNSAPRVEAAAVGDFPWSQVRIGEMPGLARREGDTDDADLAFAGACIADEVLDLPAWGEGADPPLLLAEARSGLFGEFDRVDPAAVNRAVKAHLYLGFGAEAAQYAQLLAEEAPQDVAVFTSLARLVDGAKDPASAFAGMLGCPGRAALWAALAAERLPQGQSDGPGLNTDAIVRSFQELPPHLRRALGPPLAEKFLARNDPEPARMIRDAMGRAADRSEAELALLDAKATLQAGLPDQARTRAEAALTEGTPTAEAYLALVESHLAAAEPLAAEVAASILAFRRDAAEDQLPPLDRAAVLALALSDQTAAAFAKARDSGVDTFDLWSVVAVRAGDDDLLRHAVLDAGQTAPPAAPEAALRIADRLAGLGFAEAALAWLGPVSPQDAPERRLIAARAELGLGGAQAAIALLAGLEDAPAQTLRAQAFLQLGRLEPAEAALRAAGDPEEAARLLAWQADWAGVEQAGPDAWATAAARATLPPPDAAGPAGPLGRGAALVEESAAAREALSALLATVPAPDPEAR